MARSFAWAGDVALGEVVSARLREAGFALAAGLDTADFIITYCLTQSQVEDVYLGTGGAVETAKEGCCLVDLSPSTCTLAKEVYAVARVNELQALDAPLVLKDPCEHDAFGVAGNLLCLVGGEKEAYDAASGLLRAIAGEVRYLGGAGAGQQAKAAATLHQASAILALVESHALAKSFGTNGQQAVDALVDAGLATPVAAKVFHAMEDGHFHGTYTCQVMLGEVTAALNAAEEAGTVLPQAEAAQHLLELISVVGGSDLAAPGLALVYAQEDELERYGLDWSRAEAVYGDGEGHHHDHDHGHGHDHGHDDEYGFDDYGFDEYDGLDEDDDYASYDDRAAD